MGVGEVRGVYFVGQRQAEVSGQVAFDCLITHSKLYIPILTGSLLSQE